MDARQKARREQAIRTYIRQREIPPKPARHATLSREELERQTAEYLASGGQVQTVEFGMGQQSRYTKGKNEWRPVREER